MSANQDRTTGAATSELFETQDVNPNGVIVFLASLISSLILVFLVVWVFWGVLTNAFARTGPSQVPRLSQTPPEPRIQPDPNLDLWRLRAREDQILHSYGWSDQKAGTVRIPIDRAMDLLLKQGLPVRPQTGETPGVPDTGPESGGPQTGQPMPRFHPAQPSARGSQ